MSLPFVEEGETSEDATQSIHNIVMTTEEAVNEVLIRFIRQAYLINRWNTQDRKHSNAGKRTPRSPIPMTAPLATAIPRRTELLAVMAELRESQTATITFSSMLQFTPDCTALNLTVES